MRRMSLAILATVVGVLGASSAASAAGGPVTDGQFNLKFTAGKIVIADLAETDIPAGNTVDVKANVDGTGKIAVPKTALVFPTISLTDPVPISVNISQSARSDGTIDPATGAVSLPLSIDIDIDALGLTCKIPLSLGFTTGTQTVTASKSVVGSPYNQGTGAVTLAGVAPIPDINALSAATCPAGPVLAGFLPVGANGNIGLQLAGTLEMPGGTKYADDTGTVTPPPVVVPPPVVLANPVATLGATTLKVSKGTASAAIKCAGTVAANKPCSGKATLTAKITTIKIKKVKGKKKKVKTTKTVTVGSASYSAAAGATATVKVKLSSANQKALKAAKKLTGTLTVTATGGTGFTKSITIK